MVDEACAEAPFDAQHADTGEVFRVVQDLNELIPLADLNLDSAAHATVGAGGGYASQAINGQLVSRQGTTFGYRSS